MQSQETRLLTTRLSTGVAIGLTAYVFALSIRHALHPEHTRGLLLPLDFLLHGRSLIVANVVFYGYLCWFGFWLVRGTHGLERAFVAGWFASILLSPLEHFWPEWAVAISYLRMFGLAVALLAAMALLLDLHEPSAVD